MLSLLFGNQLKCGCHALLHIYFLQTPIQSNVKNQITHYNFHTRVGWITDRDSSKAIKDESQDRVETKRVINGDLETRGGLLMTAGQGGAPHLATGSLGTDPAAPATHRPG